jgi:hypothetical protein
MSYQPSTNYNMEWQGGDKTPGYEQSSGNVVVPPHAYPPATPVYPSMEANSLYESMAAPPQQDQRRGMALAGFILSILSLVASLGIFMGANGTGEFLIWFSGVVFAIMGITLSVLGRRSISRKGLAITGLVLSILTLFLLVAIMTIGVIMIQSHSA